MSQTLRSLVWSSFALSVAGAGYIIDNLSFGHKEGQLLSPNLRAIPHYHTSGDGYDPEILSDRVVLTPPWPGSKRGALWSEDPLHHAGDWTAELHFRASGMERGAGNMQIWYTKESQKGQPPASLYTAPKFDGLVLVVDQYEWRGGAVRGFLNDGTIDIKAHPDADTLAFGMCNFAYRNLGKFSVISLHHANGVLEVKVDGNPCFSTDKIKLPEGYHFGISASSAENPDSFEVQKFLVSTTSSTTREEPKKMEQHQQQSHDQQQHQQTQQRMQQKVGGKTSIDDIPQMLSDVLAGSINSQADQFADLHNRIQIINHRVSAIYDIIERMERDNANRFNDLMSRVIPTDDRSAAVLRNVEKVERTTMEVLRDLESKDFKDMLRAVHNAIQDNHHSLSSSVPQAVEHIVGKHRPSLVTYMFVLVAVQVMLFGAWQVYKARRNSAPKKYL